MDKVRADMANFKAYIESSELPKFESRMKGISEKVIYVLTKEWLLIERNSSSITYGQWQMVC